MPDFDADFYGWANEQAALLRAGRLADVDVATIAEEIERIGRSEKRELLDRRTVLLQHPLNWQYHPECRGNSWRLTIDDQHDRLILHLKYNRSQTTRLRETIAHAYRFGRRATKEETGMDDHALPRLDPWTVDQLSGEGIYPE